MKWILVLTAVAGAGTMIVELAAVRLLAPWFGASSAVWTNVIGVVLLALSIGYLVGARLAVGPRPLAKLSAVLVVAGSFILWLPAVTAPLAEFLVPRGVSLAESPGLFTWGSLAASCLLFGPAAGLLACVGPLATEVLHRRGISHAGAAGGRVLFASTLGSLVGTFATTYLLVPRLGLSATFVGAGLLVLLSGLVLLVRTRKGVSMLLLAAGAFAISYSRTELPGPSGEEVVLATTDSSYQFLRVVEGGEAEGLYRLLQVNEGLDSFQSVWTPELGLLGAGYYYDYFVLPLWWQRSSDANVFVIGLGAGTTWRVLAGAAPSETSLRMVGAEIDPKVIEFGHAYFDLPREDPALEVLAGWDGRAAMTTLQTPCELIILDAYANQSEIPAHLSSIEFFGEVRERLTDGGTLAVNIGGFGFGDPVVQALARTVALAFDERVLLVQVPNARNIMLYAVRDGEAPEPGTLHESLGNLPVEIANLVAPIQIPGCSRWILPVGEPLTDDLNPLDRLQAMSLARGVEGWLEQ